MRNHADEILFIERARMERCVPFTTVSPTNDSHPETAKTKPATRPVLRSHWVLVDGRLQLVWWDEREEPLRCAA
jgi:hypothetical protein